MGQRRVTHLWACGPPKSVDALRTGRKESEQASQTHTTPQGTNHTHPLPRGSGGAGVALRSPRTLLSTVPGLPLWQRRAG